MAYQNAAEVLPQKLLDEIQQYVNGRVIYIPSGACRREAWGAKNGSKQKYEARNREIRRLHKSGVPVCVIAGKYFLTEDSIRKIVKKPL